MPSLALSNAFLSSRSSVCPLRLHHARSSNHRRSGAISCASSKEEEETNIVMDRRGVLLGLGGLYGSAAKIAAGAPIAPPPDFKTWRKATSPGVPDQDHASLAVRDYPFPKTPLRVRRAAQNVDKINKTPANLVTVSELGPAPRDLDSTIRVLVPRPKTNRSDEEKEKELEVLTTTGIQVNTPGPARFDVFIAKPYNGNQAGPDLGQYVGAFVQLASYTPQAGPNGPGRKQGLKLGITYAIEDIGAADASSLVVSFKPRDGKVTIGGVEIKLIETDIKL